MSERNPDGWTKEPPSEDGFYWWRFKPSDPPIVVQVNAEGHGAKTCWYAKVPGTDNDFRAEVGEWCGPLTPPEDV